MRLDLFRIEILDFQNVHLGFGSFQDPLAVQHALLKVGRLLEQLILCGDLSQLSLQWKRKENNWFVKFVRKYGWCLAKTAFLVVVFFNQLVEWNRAALHN